MSTEESTEEAGARVHWLLAGTFSTAPKRRHFKLTPENFAQSMKDAALTIQANVPDRLGGGDKRTFDLTFDNPKAFQLAQLVASIPTLQNLRALGEELSATDLAKRPTPDAAIARITELVGAGKLSAAVDAVLRPAAPAASGGASASAGDAAAVVSQGEVSKATPRSAVDAFVKAVHPTVGKSATTTNAARAARTAIEDAVFGTAVDILKDPNVARIEAAWRGLKMVVDQCPAASAMALEVVDVAPGELLDAIRENVPSEAIDQPDAIIVTDACDEAEKLAALASLGEELNAPVIVGVTHKMFGVDEPTSVSNKIEDESGGLAETWHALRNDEASRWLCAVANRVVLASDGTGSSRRTAFGNPAFALAAMLAASYRVTGSFARIMGKTGALKAGGTFDLTTGRDAGTGVPTEAFVTLRAQSRFAALGFIGLGSGRDTDMVALSSAPTARAGTDVVPLPAQILTGRIVRFAQWVRDQLPAGATDKDVVSLFEQAAGVFLFPGATDKAGLKAQIVTDKENKRGVLVSASVNAEHAAIPFHLAFTLPVAN
jgi:hypothetical protein